MVILITSLRMKRRRFTITGLTIGLGLLAGCSGGGSSGGGGGAGATGPGGITVPSGFEGASAPPAPQEGVTIARYTGSGSSSEALEAFKSAAGDAGWEGKGSVTVMGGQWSGAGFEKEDEALVIHAEESDGEVVVTVVHAPKEQTGMDDTGDSTEDTTTEEMETEEATPQQSDAGGEDHPDVPRYPGSVRTDYAHMESSDQEITENKYVAEATVDEVGTFYEEQLPAHGWTIDMTGVQNGQHGIIASKNGMQLQMAFEQSEDYEGHTNIHIVVQKSK